MFLFYLAFIFYRYCKKSWNLVQLVKLGALVDIVKEVTASESVVPAVGDSNNRRGEDNRNFFKNYLNLGIKK